MPAIETSIWLALKGRVASIVLSPAVTVVFPKESHPAQGRYLWVQWMPNRNQRLFVGSGDPHRRPGILQISVMSPLAANEAPEVDIEIAGKVAEHFPADRAMDHAGVRCRVTRAPDVAEAFRDEKLGRWHTPVSIYVEALH